MGYTEEKLKIEDVNNLSLEVLEEIKEDIITLSYNGFKLEDIFYNYTSDSNFKFFDLTSFSYVNSSKKELLDFYYQPVQQNNDIDEGPHVKIEVDYCQ